MNIRLINEAGIAETDFTTIVTAVKYFVPLVTKAWAMPASSIIAGGTPEKGDWIIYVTERKRSTGATGYHTFENGVPVAYCSPKAAGRLFGTYSRPLIVKGKTIVPPRYTSGLITTICHELAEMLCDPQIQTLSPIDTHNRHWLVEVCDHCFGSYSVFTVGTIKCILPDVTTPSFYNLQGTAPFSILGAATAPFTMTPKGYGYYKDATGKLIKL